MEADLAADPRFRGLWWEARWARLLRNPSGRHECPVRMIALMVHPQGVAGRSEG